MTSTIRVGIHLHDNTDIRIHDHLDGQVTFVAMDLNGASVFIYSITQAMELCTAAQDVVDAFVLAGEPVTA